VTEKFPKKKLDNQNADLLKLILEDQQKIQSLTSRIALVEEALTSSKQESLSLPIALPKPLPREFSLENLLSYAHNLGISEKWTRNWYAKQDVLGWKDSYGVPIRKRCQYLRYCWLIESEKQRDRPRPRQDDLTLGGYADYSKDGKGKPAKILPIPRQTSDEDCKRIREEVKKCVAQLRFQFGK
jgi:hypothetical protein